jgi:hypothetical protein
LKEKKMKLGANIEVIWFDQDCIEVRLECSNGYFSGVAEMYLGHRDLSELAENIQGFPSSSSDSRTAELGTFDPKYASGGVRMRFYCVDSRGHPAVEIQLRGDQCKGLGEVESVALRIAIEPAGLDSFVKGLHEIGTDIGSQAFLAMVV